MKPGNIYKFIQELKRRRVFRGIIVYGASTLVLLEAADIIAGAFGIDGAPSWFIWLLGIGFIGSLIFSWIYDITPGGIKKTEPEQDHKVPIPKKEVRLYQTTTFISVMIIIGLFAYNIFKGADKRKIQAIEKSIAVIPVDTEGLGYDDSQHFAFVGEQITSCLLKVKDCKVRPWEECRTYKRGNKPYHKIGIDLSAALLVVLSPYENQAQKNLFVNLIVASNGSLLLSENLNIQESWSQEVYEHSREISKKIARRLRIYLNKEERAFLDELKASPQATMLASIGSNIAHDAMDKYFVGSAGEKSEYTDSISFDRAIRFFTEAIELEPTFAEAYANRAKARLWGIAARYYDRSVLEDCRKDIEKAFELDENLPEALVAMGFYNFLGKREYKEALKYFNKAIELKPDNNEYLFYISRIHSSLGNWDKVRNQVDKVFESNPRNVLFLTNMGITYVYLGDFFRAIECQDRAINLNPEWYAPYLNKALTLHVMGRIPEAQFVMEQVREITGTGYYMRVAELDLFGADYNRAIENVELAEPGEYSNPGDEYLLKAKIYKHGRKPRLAKENYRLAEEYFLNQVKFDTRHYSSYSKLGIACAALGKDQLAIEYGQKALELAKERYSGTRYPDIMYNMALIYALIRDHESAMITIKELLNTCSLISSDYIKIDPDMMGLHDDPEFDLSNL
jgi:tetratricopeptide (TPR) repeat protein